MNIQSLITNLKNSDATVRLNIARVLGMVEETQALNALREHYQTESDPNVQAAIVWAGKRIHRAHQAGQTTVDSIFATFGVDREIRAGLPDAEAELVAQIQRNAQIEMIRRQHKAAKKKTNAAAAATLTGAALSMVGAPVPSVTMGGMLQAGADAASSNLDGERPRLGETRTPATRPTSADIGLRVARLRTSDDKQERINAARELCAFNNPQALPHLAHAFLNDPDPDVRAEAEYSGKRLYWATIYWQMEQDGSLQAAIDQRRQTLEMPKRLPTLGGAPVPAQKAPAAEEPDVNELLRHAEENRQRRLKNRRK